MICPKCGFSQPDDIYCALCGVKIEKYLRQKRKRQYRVWILMALMGIGAVSIAKYINSVYHIETPEPVDKYEENKGQIKDDTLSARKPDRVLSRSELQARKKTDHRPRSLTQREPFKPDRRERQGLVEDESSGSRPLDHQNAELSDDQQGETYSAREWFEKGRALDDESEGEIQCYRKTIEMDPEFAPAYYCIGAIYYRRANYELADHEFVKFLKYASEADRHAYNIYVYYSPSDVARLSEEKTKGQAPAEGSEKEIASAGERERAEGTEKETTRSTGEETAEPAGEETAEPAGEETVEPAGEETVEPAGEETVEPADEETVAPTGEEAAEPTVEETSEPSVEETTEPTEKEAAEPAVEETGQETSEEVMTIVGFLPVDGHILVPVVLNGFLEARVLVDTGAGITILSKELARKLPLEGEAGNSITLKTMATDIQAQLATLSSIQVGNLIRNNLRVAITDLPLGEKIKFDGILGMDFMTDYKIQIDNENNRILLSPGKKSW
jgi:predicted aspartyl protease